MLDFAKNNSVQVASVAALTAIATAYVAPESIVGAVAYAAQNALLSTGVVAAVTFGYDKVREKMNNQAAPAPAPAPAFVPRRSARLAAH